MLAVIGALVVPLAALAPRLELDAAAESLVLADDTALTLYREVRLRYGADDYLVVAYEPRGELFDPATLGRIGELRQRLAAIDGIEQVTSLLDVPLVEGAGAGALASDFRTLGTPGTDPAAARRELTQSPLYRDLIVSADGRVTALRLDLAPPPPGGREPLVADVRRALDPFRGEARILLAGIPLIVSDMTGFVRHDLRVFGLGAAALIAAILAAAFRRWRWVLVPLVLCAGAGAATAGLLALAGWRITVVSANFVAVLLIVALSLCVHLVVRYRELAARHPRAGQRRLLAAALASKLAPSLYTALTTAIAFGSLAASGLGPVADFGWIMVIGTAVAFTLVMAGFPALLARLPRERRPAGGPDPAARLSAACARLAARRGPALIAVFALVAVASVAGMARLTVDNRFVDYFRDSSEIHRGMVMIDRALGGSTPLEVIVDAPAGARERRADAPAAAGFTASSYWFNAFRLDQVKAIHDWLDARPETGKVLSLATAARVLERASGGPLDNFTLALAYRAMPQEAKDTLIAPYLSEDGLQARFAVRVHETRASLDRDRLIRRIREELPAQAGLAPEQVRVTGMMVLYNSVLQRLYGSQLRTIGVVLVLVLAMFALLLRSARLAAIGLVPNLAAAAAVLGLIGALGIPLDLMTITLAAITLGIGVDDTIHYLHRWRGERRAGRSCREAIARTHDGTGRALVITSATLALGFSVFALSSFVPAALFGLLAGFALLAALFANLTLLPALLERFEPAPVARRHA